MLTDRKKPKHGLRRKKPPPEEPGKNLNPVAQLAKQSWIATIALKVTRHDVNPVLPGEHSVKNVGRRTISQTNVVKRRKAMQYAVTEIESQASDSDYIDTVFKWPCVVEIGNHKRRVSTGMRTGEKFMLRCWSRIKLFVFVWTVKQQSTFYQSNSSQMNKSRPRIIYYRCATRRSWSNWV